MRMRTSVRYASESYRSTRRSRSGTRQWPYPPSEPANNTFSRLSGTGRMERSTVLFASSMRPSLMKWVPMLVRCPGYIKPGAIAKGIVQHHDWLPTFFAMGGTPNASWTPSFPLPPINSIPARSSAVRNLRIVSERPPNSPFPASNRFTVGSETEASRAKSSCDQPNKARAAFICVIDTFSIDMVSDN